jgi:hypothetical protein
MRQIHGEEPSGTRYDVTQAQVRPLELEDSEVRPARSAALTTQGLDREAELAGKRQADDSARGPCVDEDAHGSMIEGAGGLEVANTVPHQRHLSEMLRLKKLSE